MFVLSVEVLVYLYQIAVPDSCYTTGSRYPSWTDEVPYVFIQYNNGISSSGYPIKLLYQTLVTPLVVGIRPGRIRHHMFSFNITMVLAVLQLSCHTSNHVAYTRGLLHVILRI